MSLFALADMNLWVLLLQAELGFLGVLSALTITDYTEWAVLFLVYEVDTAVIRVEAYGFEGPEVY